MTDKPALSGAEFQRTVGADPKKWALACLDAWPGMSSEEHKHFPASPHIVEFLTGWFRDAQEAAVKAAGTSWPPQPDDSDPGMKA
jgi:hypothetical protein